MYGVGKQEGMLRGGGLSRHRRKRVMIGMLFFY